MKIAIIGHGNVGGALARSWAKAGHTILVGARNTTSEKLNSLKSHLPELVVMGIKEASQEAEVIVVATPPQVALDLIETWGNVAGKVIIDTTNAIRFKPEPYATAYHAFEARTEAGVVKCFNSTGWENMLDPNYGNQKVDMFMAGDHPHAKEIARQLSDDIGFGPCYDFGGGDKIELLEQMAVTWVNLALFQGLGRNIGVKILTRQTP